jgi:hypothetical protein
VPASRPPSGAPPSASCGPCCWPALSRPPGS